MEARSRSSSAPVLLLPFAPQRSHSPTRHFYSPSSSSSAFKFAVNRTLSPTRPTFTGASSYSSASAAASSSINFTLDRSTSQVRSTCRPISPKGGAAMNSIPRAPPRKTCMCSPTDHPGSFRCSLHRNTNNSSSSTMHSQIHNSSSSTMHSHLNPRRSTMANSLVSIGGPSSHYMRRRTSFQRRPSRFCHMTMD